MSDQREEAGGGREIARLESSANMLDGAAKVDTTASRVSPGALPEVISESAVMELAEKGIVDRATVSLLLKKAADLRRVRSDLVDMAACVETLDRAYRTWRLVAIASWLTVIIAAAAGYWLAVQV